MKASSHLRSRVAFAVLFLMGANLLIGNSYRAEQDTWISVLLASVVLVLWTFVLARISKLFPGKDVFSLLAMLPKWIGFPLISITTFYCFSQTVITLRVYSGFVHIVSLPNTTILILLVLISLTVWFFLLNDNEVLYRFSYITIIPIIFIVLLLFVFLAPMFRAQNLFPIFYNNTGDVLYCTAENFAFPFGNIFLLLGISFCPNEPKKERNVWILVAILACLLTLIIVFQNLLLLGGKLSNALDFPYNFAASLVNVGDFFSRIEVFSSLFFFLSAIVRSAYLMKLTSRGVQRLVSVSQKAVAFPLITLLCAYSAIAFENTNSVFNFLQVFPYIAFLVQFGIPLVIWFVCERTARRKNEERGELPKYTFRML